VLTVALLLKMKRIWRFAQEAAQEEDLNILATFSTNGIIYVVNLYTIHLQSNCNNLSGVFKTLLNNSKTWRNFLYANMFSTGFPPHMLRIWPETELSVRIFRHVRIWKSVIMIKCVCVQLTRNKATFKESVTVVHFEISAKGAKPNQIGCGGKTVKGVFVFVLTGRIIGVSSLMSSIMNTCLQS